MWDRPAFKETGRANFKASYWPFVAVSVLLTLLTGQLLSLNVKDELTQLIQLCQDYGFTSSEVFYLTQSALHLLIPLTGYFTVLGFALKLLVTNPYEVGASRFFLENTTFHTAPFSRVAVGFTGNYGNVVLTQFLRNLYTFLWSLLFVIPGIVRGYGYFAVPYILSENPNLDHRRVLDLSRQMTMGYKWELFVTDLSFLGWNLLSALTLGLVGVFYVNPYYYATRAEIYRFLRAKAMEQGITSAGELPGMGSL